MTTVSFPTCEGGEVDPASYRCQEGEFGVTEEQNSAERAAEEILEAAYAEARAEACPQGAACGVHFRVDEEAFEVDELWARLITYVGDYVVVTDDNHKLDDPSVIISILLGKVAPGSIPRWETTVYLVGEGTISDLSASDKETRKNSVRYTSTHDKWDEIKDQHTAAVVMLESGLLDVSKPVFGD